MLSIKQHSEQVYVISGGTREEVALTMMRFQEFYENPIYRNVDGFSVEDIQKWQYDLTPDRKYEEQWAGFNIPGHILVTVLQSHKFRPLTEREQELSTLLDTHLPISTKILSESYFIAIGLDEPEYDDILIHEYAHALFTTNEVYSKEQRQNVMNLPYDVFSATYKFLQDIGYNESTVIDEIHAYMLVDTDLLTEHIPGYDFHVLSKPFCETYAKHKD